MLEVLQQIQGVPPGLMGRLEMTSGVQDVAELVQCAGLAIAIAGPLTQLTRVLIRIACTFAAAAARTKLSSPMAAGA
jgi:hypothetical protein